MERTNYFVTQHILSDDLNTLVSTKRDQLFSRTQSVLGQSSSGSYPVFKGGVFGDPSRYQYSSSSLGLSFAGPTTLIVASGSALTASGELVYLPSPVTVDLSQVIPDPINRYNWIRSASEGTSTVTNYVTLVYVEASGSIDYDFLGVPHYKRYTPEPWVLITSSIVPSSNTVVLGSFQTSPGHQPRDAGITDLRSYVTLVTAADAVALDPLAAPASGFGWTTFDQHATAYGTGTPSRTNVHGISYADVGASSALGALNTTSFATITTAPIMVDNWVYRNTLSSVLGVAVTCNILAMGDDTNTYDGRYTLEAASVGVLGAGGALTGPITLDSHYVRLSGQETGTASTASVTRTLFGFIPPSWYYRIVGVIAPPKALGTIIQSTYYL